MPSPDIFVLDLDQAAGILTFPSVHAGVAALCAWAAWNSPLLRYPVLALNGAMAVSAITHGSHYLMDVIAGLGCAGVCVTVVRPFFGEQGEAATPASCAADDPPEPAPEVEPTLSADCVQHPTEG